MTIIISNIFHLTIYSFTTGLGHVTLNKPQKCNDSSILISIIPWDYLNKSSRLWMITYVSSQYPPMLSSITNVASCRSSNQISVFTANLNYIILIPYISRKKFHSMRFEWTQGERVVRAKGPDIYLLYIE